MLQNLLDQLSNSVGTYVPSIIGALVVLVVGWLVATILAAVTRKVLKKTRLDEQLASWITGDDPREAPEAGEWISRGVFYLVMLFVIVAFFQTLQLTLIAEPMNGLLNRVFEFAPQVLGAIVLIGLAWLVATVLKKLIIRVLSAARLDERLGGQAVTERQDVPLTRSIAEVVYWLVFLLFLPAVLTTLELEGLLLPIQQMINEILGFLPNIFTAGIILFAGWFVARIIQRIVTNLAAAIGSDQLSERVGLAGALGEQKLSSLLGLVVYILVLIPVIISALNALSLDAITVPASNMLNLILEAIPAIFAAMIILMLAFVVGRVASGLVTNLLAGIGFNTLLEKAGLTVKGKKRISPSEVVGSIVLVAIMFFAVTEAFNMLGFSALAELTAEFIVFGSHILLGLVIFAAGLYLSNLVADTVRNSTSNQSHLLSILAKSAILLLAGAMSLRHMGLANEIINMAFGLVIGAIAVAAAVAFGIGGRDLAAAKLKEWNDELQEGKPKK